MEKLLYVFWRGRAGAADVTRRFLGEIAPRMRALGAERVQFNIADFSDLSGALVNFTLHSTQPAPDGIGLERAVPSHDAKPAIAGGEVRAAHPR
jgi:hypothetical protein